MHSGTDPMTWPEPQPSAGGRQPIPARLDTRTPREELNAVLIQTAGIFAWGPSRPGDEDRQREAAHRIHEALMLAYPELNP